MAGQEIRHHDHCGFSSHHFYLSRGQPAPGRSSSGIYKIDEEPDKKTGKQTDTFTDKQTICQKLF
jgi:hypothetical protein